MRTPIGAPLPIRALLMAVVLPLAAHGGEAEYKLLELDGYRVKWGKQALGVEADVSYALADERLRFDDARNCRHVAPIDALVGGELRRETLARETARAFEVWEQAAGLSFHQVSDAREADIVIGAQGRPRGRAFANVSYARDTEPENRVRAIEQAQVCLNPESQWKVGFDGNRDVYDLRFTLIHEIGHAIGLDHPGASGEVMAFRYTEAFDELQDGDLLGVRKLYGRGSDDHRHSGDSGLHLSRRLTDDEQTDESAR